MEEKLLELIKESMNYSNNSNKKYIEVNYSGDNNNVEINIRDKNTYDYLFKLEIKNITNDESLKLMNDAIKAIKEYMLNKK